MTSGTQPAPDGEAGSGERLRPADVEQLYADFSADVYAFLVGVLRNVEDAREALQCTFRRCLEAGHTARAETRKGWLFKVAYHEAMGLKRRSGAHQKKLIHYSESLEARRLTESLEGSSPQEMQLMSAEDICRLREALQELPEEQRWVVERRIHAEETFATIAEHLNVPIGTVLTRMRLALSKLKSKLEDLQP